MAYGHALDEFDTALIEPDYTVLAQVAKAEQDWHADRRERARDHRGLHDGAFRIGHHFTPNSKKHKGIRTF